MQPDSAVSATDCTIDHEPVPDTQRAAGSPTTGSAVLGEFGGCEVGVWETTPGTMTDTEADELFVVLSGPPPSNSPPSPRHYARSTSADRDRVRRTALSNHVTATASVQPNRMSVT